MKPFKIGIIGQEGTTGLQIKSRLQGREDIVLMTLPEEKRKDMEAIRQQGKEADLLFLCLPDEASRQVVEATADLSCRIIDASTAFRTEANWAYGFAELGAEYKKKIEMNRYIANPGCHASGCIALVKPLVQAGVVGADYPLQVLSLTGYSGGGKKMIQEYEGVEKKEELFAPRQYGLGQCHKHLKEIQYIGGLTRAPLFTPVVDDYYKGMLVTIGLHRSLLKKNVDVETIHTILATAYENGAMVDVLPLDLGAMNKAFLSASALAGTDKMEIMVTGNEERMLLHARYDNLGKGASGSAVQCMNIALGLEETKGLVCHK